MSEQNLQLEVSEFPYRVLVGETVEVTYILTHKSDHTQWTEKVRVVDDFALKPPGLLLLDKKTIRLDDELRVVYEFATREKGVAVLPPIQFILEDGAVSSERQEFQVISVLDAGVRSPAPDFTDIPVRMPWVELIIFTLFILLAVYLRKRIYHRLLKMVDWLGRIRKSKTETKILITESDLKLWMMGEIVKLRGQQVDLHPIAAFIRKVFYKQGLELSQSHIPLEIGFAANRDSKFQKELLEILTEVEHLRNQKTQTVVSDVFLNKLDALARAL